MLRALLVILVICGGIGYSWQASAQESQINALIEAANGLKAIQVEIQRVRSQMKAITDIHPDPASSPMAEEYASNQRELADWIQKYNAARPAYSHAQDSYAKAVAPRTELLRLALKYHQMISTTPANPVLKRRALYAIEYGISKLAHFPLQKAKSVVQVVEQMASTATSGEAVGAIIGAMTQGADDGALQEILLATWGQVDKELMDHPGQARIAAWNERLGQIGLAVSLFRTLGDEHGGANARIDRIIDATTFVAKIPGADELPLMGTYLKMMALMLGDIQKNVTLIERSTSQQNLDVLYNYVLTAENEVGEAIPGRETIDRDVLFAHLGPNPKILPSKLRFAPAEHITGHWHSSWYYGEDAWLGIFKAEDAPLSDSAYENDAFDFNYIRLQGRDREGDYDLAHDLDPGQYVLRMFDANAGVKVAEARIAVGRNKPCVSSNPPPIASDFRDGSDDWSIYGDALLSTSSGLLIGRDEQKGITWYYLAPAKFLGDQSGMIGGHLRFREARLVESLADYYIDDGIILEGSGRRVTHAFSLPDFEKFSDYDILLSAADGWKSADGRPASEEDLCYVLGGLTGVKIRGEFFSGPDSSWLADVSMSP